MRIPVLIVGAGPSGLMAACQLARHGVPFRIIDGKERPTLQSRAMVVQCRSLEVYDQLSLAENCFENGNVMEGLCVFVKGVRRFALNLTDWGKLISPFSGVLVLEQSKNEAMLVDKLHAFGGKVEWRVLFKSMVAHDGHCEVQLQHADGVIETIEADYVVACDGASSPVRHALDLPFGGGTYSATFYVADVDVEGETLPRDKGSMFLDDEGFAVSIPMMGGEGFRFRLIGAVPTEAHEKPGWLDNPDFSVVADAFRRLTALPLDMKPPQWFSTYSVHHRKLDHFRHRRVLFVGDSAHVHSPAGGQGMNTGLLDAQNLGWKLAYVARGLAYDSLLDTYDEEREALASRLLSTTDNAFRIMFGGSGVKSLLRQYIMPLLGRLLFQFPFMRELFFRRLSQTAIEYRTSRLSRAYGTPSSLKAGDRFPPFALRANGTSVNCSFDLLKRDGFCAFDFINLKDSLHKEIMQGIESRIGVPLHYFKCEASSGEMEKGGIAPLLYVVRPDMYVGLTCSAVEEAQLLDYFGDFMRINGT